ncbi:MAG: hypothetical protein VX874_12280 [Pseudomonadota bacterium]|nr:hypothetical protein [Pseudomonadota bacterium]
MTKVIMGAALVLLATSAVAGTLVEPIMDQAVIVQDTASSAFSHAIIPPIFFLLIAGIAIFL